MKYNTIQYKPSPTGQDGTTQHNIYWNGKKGQGKTGQGNTGQGKAGPGKAG